MHPKEMISKLEDAIFPKCLYCGEKCEISSSGDVQIEFIKYNCISCLERVAIVIFINSNKKDILISCNDLDIRYIDSSNVINISKQTEITNGIDVPYFELDLTNKEQLYRKIKVYLTFS